MEVELRCPVCRDKKQFRVRQAPETLHYTCRDSNCGGFDQVFSWDPAHCEVVGPPEVLASRVEAKRGVQEYYDRVIVNSKRTVAVNGSWSGERKQL